jgi:pimeloyl-ACP methyl ester carboxylesterase
MKHEEDSLKENQDRLRLEIHESELRAFPGAGHTVQWELPAEVATAISSFIESK